MTENCCNCLQVVYIVTTYVNSFSFNPRLQTKDSTVCSFAFLHNRRSYRSLDALKSCLNKRWFAVIRQTHVTIARFKKAYDTSQNNYVCDQNQHETIFTILICIKFPDLNHHSAFGSPRDLCLS